MINMNRSLVTLTAGAALLPSGILADDSPAVARRPNVVVLLIDDLGYGDIGASGCPDIPTPNIDSLAADGMRCVNGYTTCAVCTPSRTAMLTGMYQQRLGVYSLEQRGLAIPDDHPTIAEFMRDAGYVTGMVGQQQKRH